MGFKKKKGWGTYGLFSAYRSSRQGQDRVRLHDKGRIRQDGFCCGVEVGTAWVLEEVGVAIDKRVDTSVI